LARAPTAVSTASGEKEEIFNREPNPSPEVIGLPAG